jgi:hypothetical protein
MVVSSAYSLFQKRHHRHGQNHHGEFAQKLKRNAILEAWREAQPNVEDWVRLFLLLIADGGRRLRTEERCIFWLQIWITALE